MGVDANLVFQSELVFAAVFANTAAVVNDCLSLVGFYGQGLGLFDVPVVLVPGDGGFGAPCQGYLDGVGFTGPDCDVFQSEGIFIDTWRLYIDEGIMTKTKL